MQKKHCYAEKQTHHYHCRTHMALQTVPWLSVNWRKYTSAVEHDWQTYNLQPLWPWMPAEGNRDSCTAGITAFLRNCAHYHHRDDTDLRTKTCFSSPLQHLFARGMMQKHSEMLHCCHLGRLCTVDLTHHRMRSVVP